MKNSIIALMALPLIVASCSNQEFEPASTGDNIMTVDVQVKKTSSRAGYSTDNLTEFALMVDNQAAPSFNINTKIVKGAEGWAAYDGTPLLWDNGLNAVSAVAFAPYRDNVTMTTNDLAIEAKEDQSTEEAVLASDFLLMSKCTVTPTADNKNLNVVLSHKMAKLVITVTGTKTGISELAVNGLKVKGTVDLTAADAPVALAGEAASVTPFVNDGVYEAIVLPQDLNSDFTITFKDGDDMYRWTHTGSGKLASGFLYNINLEINKPNEVSLADNITVCNWNESGETSYFQFEE